MSDFLTWLFRDDHVLSIDTRIKAVQELLQLAQDEAYQRGLAAPRGPGDVAGNTETQAAIDAAWERILRTAGKTLPRHRSSHHFARKDLKALAKFIAIVVRNAMENFHVKHLSDEQMRELNPIIRNAVFTALDAWSSMDRSEAARKWVEYQALRIPNYWEEPELLDAYVKSITASGDTPANSADEASAVSVETP